MKGQGGGNARYWLVSEEPWGNAHDEDEGVSDGLAADNKAEVAGRSRYTARPAVTIRAESYASGAGGC